MEWHKDTIEIITQGKGLHPFTEKVNDCIQKMDIQTGICYLFIQHTSASLLISESYDPSAKKDLESFMDRIAPENQNWHEHTMEGKDDSPSHMRTMLTHTSEFIPIDRGKLNLGTW